MVSRELTWLMVGRRRSATTKKETAREGTI